MPELISKAEAVKSLQQSFPLTECLMCDLNLKSELIVYQDDLIVAFLSAYPRYWGHCIVSLRRHVENIQDVTDSEYYSLMGIAKRLAVILEKNFSPERVYIALLGAEENRINTCPHIHVNVLPVFDKNVRPSEVFTWENGIYSGSKEEWIELKGQMASGLSS